MAGVRPPRDQPQLDTHLGFLLAEDEALKSYLSNITIPSWTDTNSGKVVPSSPLGVWYRWPTSERQIRYPFCTLDLINVQPAYDLFTSVYSIPEREQYRPSVSPTMPTPPLGWGVQGYSISNYLPMRLTYQVVVHARSTLHDRYLQSIFATDVFPPRPWWVHVAADDTWRRTELSQATQLSDQMETNESGTKRIFRKVYTISMLGEIPVERLSAESAIGRVLRVLVPIVDLDFVDSYATSYLNGTTDLLEEPAAEREAAGEYGVIYHQGIEVPAPPP